MISTILLPISIRILPVSIRTYILKPYNDLIQRTGKNSDPFMSATAIIAFLGQPLFFIIWRYIFPQPFESLTLRLIAGFFCLPMIFRKYWPVLLRRITPYYWQLGVLINLPFIFSVFLLKNNFSLAWAWSMLASAFLLTFFVDWISAIVLFISGTSLAWVYYNVTAEATIDIASYLEILLISFFTLFMGGAMNYRVFLYRKAQRKFEKKMMMISNQNKNMMRQYNQILSRFLNNILVQRLIKLQDEHGLETAIKIITKQERRFCGIMQADVRNFTKMLNPETEHEVAQLISRCFAEITKFGQDIAVIKLIGDCIFVYCDDENGKETAVRNILSLSLLFVHSVEKINQTLIPTNTPPLNFGIALHAGEVIYGNMASETFIDPTIIGLNVNKTARLEALTKTPDIRNLVGINGIVLSEEFAALSKQYFALDDMIHIDLNQLNVSVRDFPTIRTVYAITRETAELHHHMVQTYIYPEKKGGKMNFDIVDKNSYQGVEYYYDMQGIGADISWNIIIDVARFSKRAVEFYVSRHLRDLDCEIGDGAERWLEFSTEKSPGEYDEVEIEEKIIKIIEGLININAPTYVSG